jgi:hypothetical protein
MMGSRRAVLVCCDGLGREWVGPGWTPVLHRLALESVWYDEHRAVFPSVTRVSAASVATGCEPRRHGLHGNRMGLLEEGRLQVRDVGHPDFRTHMRRATGKTLRVPTVAERVAGLGGCIAFSNVSPGAAYFLDPEHFGHVYHRAGSFAPGGAPITGDAALEVSHDLAGDWAMTQRFCGEVLRGRAPSVAVLWLANPDLTLHGAGLGSPAHLEALHQTGRCVSAVLQTVRQLRAEGEDILLLVGSDHGQETMGESIDMEAWLSSRGLGEALDQGQIAVAGQGTAALLYATGQGRAALLEVLDALRQQPWVDSVLAEGRLPERGLDEAGGLVAAVNMAGRERNNAHGVPGERWVVAEPGKVAVAGHGNHGGWGQGETRPFLIINHAALAPAVVRDRTSLLDLAPTMLAFLGLAATGMDGRALVDIEFAQPWGRIAVRASSAPAPFKP